MHCANAIAVAAGGVRDSKKIVCMCHCELNVFSQRLVWAAFFSGQHNYYAFEYSFPLEFPRISLFFVFLNVSHENA